MNTFSVIKELFSQFNNTNFYQILAFSFVMGILIIIISFPFALYSVKKLHGDKLVILALGLFLLFSFSPVLKVLAINKLSDHLSPLFLLKILYLIHLLPLYSLIFLFTFSFLSKNIFDFSECHNIKFPVLLKYFVKKMWMTIITFWNFAVVYMIFDTSKDMIDSGLFSFQEIRASSPSYIFSGISPLKIDLINVIPIVLFLFPAIIFLFKSPPIIFGNNETDQSIFTPKLSFLRKIRISIKESFTNKHSLIVYFPFVIYLILILTTFNVEHFDCGKIGNVFIFCMTTSVIVVYVFLFVFYSGIKSMVRKFLIPILFLLALIPGEIIGYLLNWIDFPPDIKMGVGLFLFYGVFPVFFINLSSLQNRDVIALSKNLGLNFWGQIRIKQILNSSGIVLSLMFFAILICNDSAITSSLNIPNMKDQSIAYDLSYAIMNNKELIGTLPTQLIITNALLIIGSPFFPYLFGEKYPVKFIESIIKN
jgi:hypothetical protein